MYINALYTYNLTIIKCLNIIKNQNLILTTIQLDTRKIMIHMEDDITYKCKC